MEPNGGGASSARSIETSSQIPLGISMTIVYSTTFMTLNSPDTTGASFWCQTGLSDEFATLRKA